MSKKATATLPPLTENADIKELLGILSQSNMNAAAKEFLAVVCKRAALAKRICGR